MTSLREMKQRVVNQPEEMKNSKAVRQNRATVAIVRNTPLTEQVLTLQC